MSHVEYVDAQSSIKALRLAEGASQKIKYGSLEPDEFIKVEHVVQGKKHLLRAFTANGRLIGVHTYGDGQSLHSTHEKALDALKKRLHDHLYTIAKNNGVQTSGLY
jgi:hypothetical protein